MDVVVVGFNPANIIIESLLRLAQYRDGVNRIILIDNGSKNKTNIMKCVGLVDLLFSFKEQVSLGAAWNMGMHLAETPYVVLANDDILYSNNWLPPLVEAMDADSQLGIVQPYNTNGEPPISVELPKPEVVPVMKGQYAGCCFMVRKDLIEPLKEFDQERWPGDWEDYTYVYEGYYPVSFEDQDFYKRVQGAGFDIKTHTGSYVHHMTAETMKQITNWEEIKASGRELFVKRWGVEPKTHLEG